MPSYHFKTGPKWLFQLLFELEGHIMHCLRAEMSPRTRRFSVMAEGVAREPFDNKKKVWYQNVHLIYCNKIG